MVTIPALPRRIVSFPCPKNPRHSPVQFAEPTMAEYAMSRVPVKQGCACKISQKQRQAMLEKALSTFGLLS